MLEKLSSSSTISAASLATSPCRLRPSQCRCRRASAQVHHSHRHPLRRRYVAFFCVDRPAFFDGDNNAGKIVVQQHYIGSFLGDISVPLTPIAMPMSASFSAGASFTPSPVTASICCFFLQCHNNPYFLVGIYPGKNNVWCI
jgi:hypothetical protein